MAEKKSTAGLLHLIDVDLPSGQLELSENIKICRIDKGRIRELYEKMCAEQGIDDGEPFSYESYVLLEVDDDPIGDPYSLFDRVCNVIVIVLRRPIALCRILQSEDRFSSCQRTYEVYQYGMETEFFDDAGARFIDQEKGAQIKEAWNSASALWTKHKSAGRVNSSLTYFYHAWRSAYLDQCCLNLAVCLELLFTPHAQGEASHQISFNVAKFLGKSQAEMKDIYRTVRAFYNVRSRIVHGGLPDQDKVINAALETFQLASRCLKKILINGFGSIFDSDARRRELLGSFLFH
jgi:Apea-like HEPN